MNTKLTLKLNADVISQAKRYARRQGTSLSAIVENYFQMLNKEKSKKYFAEDLAGCLKNLKNLSDDDIMNDYIKGKHHA
jgi:hypothetical protein